MTEPIPADEVVQIAQDDGLQIPAKVEAAEDRAIDQKALPPKAGRKTLRALLFGKIADYARRYLTASVDHRLTLIQDKLEVLSSRNDRIEALLGGLTGSQAAQADRLLGLLLGKAAESQGETLSWLETLQAQGHDIELIARGLKASLENAQGMSARHAATLDGVQTSLGALPSLMGPRFDEIEVKIRPLVTFDEDSYAIRLRDGYAMVPRSEPVFAVMVANATSEGLEPGTRRVLQALIEPGMVVADVGANVGLLTLACAVATGPSGRVLAFEPEAGPRAQLMKTRHLNGLRWVDVHDLAVGAKTEVKTFNVSPVIGHSSLYALPEEDGAGREIAVQVTRLDDVIAKGARLDVVKIDVEGAELDVLSGMDRILKENPDIALVAEYGPSHLARIGITPKAWFKAFKDAGFDGYAISEPSGVCRKVNYGDLKDVVSVNLAFVRSKGAAYKRLPK
jgi:FkbM family methyltransferase